MGAADDRDRFVDVVRVGSILVVVLGHWLMAAVVRLDGELRTANALAAMPWLQPLTWVLQVVPLFFVAAGFANARALSRPGRSTATFVAQRVVRVVPTPVVMVTVVGLALVVAGAAGAPPSTLHDVGAVVAQPLWFLAVYLLVALVAPLQLRLHRRQPWLVLVTLPIAAGAMDLVRFAHGEADLATANYLLVFAFAQEIGFWYADGRLSGWAPGRWAALALGAYAIVVVLTAAGPYPVSMIGLKGQVSNMAPPTICVAVLTVGQVGLLMAVRPSLVRALRRPGVWRMVAAGNGLALSLFAWHLAALVLAYGAAAWLGVGTPTPGSAAWWLTKPLILLGAGAVLAGLVAATVPLDRRLAGATVRSTTTATALITGLLTASAFAFIAAWGLTSPLSISDAGLFGLRGPAALAIGSAVVAWVVVANPRRPARSRGPG